MSVATSPAGTSPVGYGLAPTTKASTDAAAPHAGKTLLRRIYDLIIEARMRQAQDVLIRHSHLIPHDLEQVGWKVSARSEDSLPFVR